jgi:hypothetical protein
VNYRFPPRADLEYDEPPEGFPDDACSVCGGKPSSIRVRWWETSQKQPSPKQFVRAGRSESHFFCVEHRSMSERVYVRFTSMRQKQSSAVRAS